MNGNVGKCAHVPFRLSTYQLSRSESTSSPHRRSGKKDKQFKQHDYVTSTQSDQGQHHLNTSIMFNSVRTTVYFTQVVCYRAESKGEKGNKKRWKVATM